MMVSVFAEAVRRDVVFKSSFTVRYGAAALHRMAMERGALEIELIIILLVTRLMDDGQTAEFIQGNLSAMEVEYYEQPVVSINRSLRSSNRNDRMMAHCSP